MADFPVKTAAQHRDDMLRVRQVEYARIGITNPNLGPGSDAWIDTTSVGNELEALGAGLIPAVDAGMPDTATGPDLDRWLNRFVKGRRPAGPSSGGVLFITSSPSPVVLGQQLTSALGNAYQVTVGGTYANGATIPIQSVGTGSGTDVDPATILTWASPPPYAGPYVNVDTLGLTGGVNDEDDDTARARLFAFFRDPPTSGNASDEAEAAETVAAVQKAFPYPCANGPGTVHVAVVGYASTSASGSRVVSNTTLAAATSAIFAAFPEFAEYVVTKTADSLADLTLLMQLPAATTAVPAGTGGGWIDGVPFPTPADTTIACKVSGAPTSATSFAINNCLNAPAIGSTICWMSPATLTLYTATVLTLTSFAANVATFTIDIPFTGLAANDYVFPAAVNSLVYVKTILAQFAALGPGEKTNAAGLLPRAYRRPRWFQSWDYNIGPKFKKSLEDSGEEVLDVSWGYQNGGVTAPALPAAITDPPKIFAPRRLGFYPMGA